MAHSALRAGLAWLLWQYLYLGHDCCVYLPISSASQLLSLIMNFCIKYGLLSVRLIKLCHVCWPTFPKMSMNYRYFNFCISTMRYLKLDLQIFGTTTNITELHENGGFWVPTENQGLGGVKFLIQQLKRKSLGISENCTCLDFYYQSLSTSLLNGYLSMS